MLVRMVGPVEEAEAVVPLVFMMNCWVVILSSLEAAVEAVVVH